jgi:hypothetical protein
MRLISKLSKKQELISTTSVTLLKRLCGLLLSEKSNQAEEKKLKNKSGFLMNLLKPFCTQKWDSVKVVISIWSKLKKEMKFVSKMLVKESSEELLENHILTRSAI